MSDAEGKPDQNPAGGEVPKVGKSGGCMRSRRESAAEVFGDWKGEYEFPEDLPRGVGGEVDWGGPVGGEVW